MKPRWHRQVRLLTVLGAAGAVLFAIAAAPAFAHPLPAGHGAGVSHTLRQPAGPRANALRGTSTVTVTGVVENFNGTPYTDGAFIMWSTSSGTGGGMPAITDATGNFTLTNVDAITNGIIYVEFADGSALTYTAQDFAAELKLELRPGSIPVTVAHPIDTTFNPVDMWGGELDLAYSALAGSTGTVLAPPGVVDRAVVYTYYNSAVRWHGTATVVAGAQSTTPIDVDADQSSTVYIRGWASGAAGSKISYQILRWPKLGRADIEGWSEHRGAADHYYGLWTSPGLNVTRTFIVPKTAPPGYPYEIHATNHATSSATDDGLDIYDAFQVCSLHTSAWTIRRGHSILLSGIVPTSTAARMGEHPGPVKQLLVWARTTAAGQPSVWKATDLIARGWTKVATVKSGGSGYYKTKALYPRKTTWYVVQYPGDSWNWRAFTSVIKVTVK